MCYPNTYYTGMSNLGFHHLFHLVSSFHGLRTARFFIEKGSRIYSPDFYNPRKRGIFSGKLPSLNGLDVVFFTISYELDYINVVNMLRASGLAPVSENRGRDCPFVIIGGIAATANPQLASAFADLVFCGDMDGSLERVLAILQAYSFQKSRSLFQELAGVEGALLYPERAHARRFTAENIGMPAHTAVLTPHTEFAGMFLVEIARGCRNTCRFCMARCVNSPPRSVPADRIIQAVNTAEGHTARVGLIAPVLNDHPDFIALVHRINQLGFKVSLSSMRADYFTEETARLMAGNDQHTLTLAPETGSEGLRERMGKNLTDQSLLNAVSCAVQYGIKKLRYYFMYGLPGESIRDIYALVHLVERTRDLISTGGGRLHLSINPFVPKKNTLLENFRLPGQDYYREVQSLLKQKLQQYSEVSLRFESLRKLHLHYYLSMGRRHTGVLLSRSMEEGSLKDFSWQSRKMFEMDGSDEHQGK
ncbi:MAG: B12-binding domain-containing radical SAM protein [Spirochaetota bacterium]